MKIENFMAPVSSVSPKYSQDKLYLNQYFYYNVDPKSDWKFNTVFNNTMKIIL